MCCREKHRLLDRGNGKLHNKEQQRRHTIRYIFSHVPFLYVSHLQTCTAFSGIKQLLFFNMSISVHYKCAWNEFVDGKQALYICNCVPNLCKQTISPLRHVKFSFSSLRVVGPCNQPARLQTNIFNPVKKTDCQ